MGVCAEGEDCGELDTRGVAGNAIEPCKLLNVDVTRY